MSIKLRTPSNGSVTLSPQDTASDVVLTVPAGTSTMVTNATLPTQLNASGDAPIYACRAWVNFNGTGTVAIRASGNVSSITDNGAGDYTVNFTTAMPDANYAANINPAVSSPNMLAIRVSSQLAAGVRVNTVDAAGTLFDPSAICVAIFR